MTSTTPSTVKPSMNLEQATTYLKKLGEWESASKFNRETILGWANFLKEKENNNPTTKKQTSKSTSARK